MVFFGLSLLGGLIGISQGNSDASGSVGLGAILFALGVYLYNKSKEALEKVKLKSYIKIIISGSNKLYLFNKNAPDSEKVADFLEKVEETLTKYN